MLRQSWRRQFCGDVSVEYVKYLLKVPIMTWCENTLCRFGLIISIGIRVICDTVDNTNQGGFMTFRETGALPDSVTNWCRNHSQRSILWFGQGEPCCCHILFNSFSVRPYIKRSSLYTDRWDYVIRTLPVACYDYIRFRSRKFSIIPCVTKYFIGGTLVDLPLTVVLKISLYICTSNWRDVVSEHWALNVNGDIPLDFLRKEISDIGLPHRLFQKLRICECFDY